jgi:hypothetical protein
MSDEQLHDLAVAVRRRTDALPATPVPWAALERGHRNRLRRRASVAAAGAVAAVAGLLVAVTGVLGGPTTSQEDVAPAGPWPGDPGLAEGSAWARDLHRGVENTCGYESGGGESRVLYADDVAGARIALVRARPAAGDRAVMYCWYTGPAGAPAAAMDMQSGNDATPAYAVLLPLPPGATEATALTLGPPGADLTVWSHDDVTRDGRAVSPRVTGRETAPGVYTARLPVPFNHARVELRGLPGGDHWSDYVSNSDVRPPPLDDAAWWTVAAPGARGDDAAGPPDKLLIGTIYQELALPSQIPGARVLWSQAVGAERHSLLALRAPAGGWAVTAVVTRPRQTFPDGGYSEGSTVLSAEPRPDGDLSRLAFAWYATGDRLGVVGPPQATAVRLTTPSTQPWTVPLPGGAGAVRAVGVRSVEFLDAAGQGLGRVDVSAPWNPDVRLHRR